MANHRHIAIYLTLACHTLVAVGQSVEQECNILKTLDTLSTKIEQLESLFMKVKQLEPLSMKVKQLESLPMKNKQLESLSMTVKHLETQIKDMAQNSGSTYIRWGRTSCPGNGSELVYSGYAGGSDGGDRGAAVDYLCLPQDPIFDHYNDRLQRSGYVYGAKYEFRHMPDIMTFFPNVDPAQNILKKDAPCAVCLTQRASVMTVPARNICHDGWTLEYKGYLSSGPISNQAATQYVCLDDQPEFIDGVHRDTNGKSFNLVEGRCGALECPPYVNGRELTCAICSK